MSPDSGAVAIALGGKGCLGRSLDELRAATAKWLADPSPMIIDLRISRNVLPMTCAVRITRARNSLFMSLIRPRIIDPFSDFQIHSSLETRIPVQTHSILEKTST